MTREEEIREAIDKAFPCTNGGRSYEQSIGANGEKRTNNEEK